MSHAEEVSSIPVTWKAVTALVGVTASSMLIFGFIHSQVVVPSILLAADEMIDKQIESLRDELRGDIARLESKLDRLLLADARAGGDK